MYRHETYLVAYFAVILGVCLNDYIQGKTLYECLVGIVERRVYHFCLSFFFIGAIYVIGHATVSLLIGALSPLEKDGVQENAMRYLGNICLGITLFADHITIRYVVLFAFVLGLKVLHWLIGFRVDALEKTGSSCTRMERVVFLTSVLFFLDGFLAYYFMKIARADPGISILFAFEFFILWMYTIRSIYAVCVLYKADSSVIEDRIFLIFYGEFVFCAVKILGQISCLLWTTITFKMPFNLLRECITDVKSLVIHTKKMIAYRALIGFLTKCPDVSGDSLGSNKTCLICHEDMEVGKRLECTHVFHFVYLKEWLHRQQACPVCRKEVAPAKKEASSTSQAATAGASQRARPSPVQVVLGEQDGEEYEGIPVSMSDVTE